MFGRKKKKMAETIESLRKELDRSNVEKESLHGEIDSLRDTLNSALEGVKKSGASANATTTTITSMDADDLTRSLMLRETEFLSVIKNMTGLFETASADNRAVSENVKVLTDAYLKMNETVVALASEVQKLQLKIDTLSALPAPLAEEYAIDIEDETHSEGETHKGNETIFENKTHAEGEACTANEPHEESEHRAGNENNVDDSAHSEHNEPSIVGRLTENDESVFDTVFSFNEGDDLVNLLISGEVSDFSEPDYNSFLDRSVRLFANKTNENTEQQNPSASAQSNETPEQPNAATEPQIVISDAFLLTESSCSENNDCRTVENAPDEENAPAKENFSYKNLSPEERKRLVERAMNRRRRH